MNIPAELWGHPPGEGKSALGDEATRPAPVGASSGSGSGLSGQSAPPLRRADVTPPFTARPPWRVLFGEERRQTERRQRTQAVLLDTRIRERRMTGGSVTRICCTI